MYKIKFPKSILLILLVYCKVDLENPNTQTTKLLSSNDNKENFSIYSRLMINEFQDNEKYGGLLGQEIELEVCGTSTEKNTLKSNQKIYELCKLIFRNTSKYKDVWPFLTHKKIRVDSWCKYTFCGGSHKAIFYKDDLEILDDIEYDENFYNFMNINKIINEYNFADKVEDRIFYDLYILYKRVLCNYKKFYKTPVNDILNSCLGRDKNLDCISKKILEFTGIDDLALIKENLEFKPILDKIILAYVFIGVKEYMNTQFEKSLLDQISKTQYMTKNYKLTTKLCPKIDVFNEFEKMFLGIALNPTCNCLRNKIGLEPEILLEKTQVNFSLRNDLRCILFKSFPADTLCTLNLFSFLLKIILLVSIILSIKYSSDIVIWPLCTSSFLLLIYYLVDFVMCDFKLLKMLYRTNSTLNFEKMKEEIVLIVLDYNEKKFSRCFLCYKNCVFGGDIICKCISCCVKTFCKYGLLKKAKTCLCNSLSYCFSPLGNICCHILNFIFSQPKT